MYEQTSLEKVSVCDKLEIPEELTWKSLQSYSKKICFAFIAIV